MKDKSTWSCGLVDSRVVEDEFIVAGVLGLGMSIVMLPWIGFAVDRPYRLVGLQRDGSGSVGRVVAGDWVIPYPKRHFILSRTIQDGPFA